MNTGSLSRRVETFPLDYGLKATSGLKSGYPESIQGLDPLPPGYQRFLRSMGCRTP